MNTIYQDEWLVLEVPTAEHKKQAVAFILEMVARGQKPHGTGGLDHAETYEAWLKVWDKNCDRPYYGYESDERVPHITFFGIRKTDNKLVGMVDIRKHLSKHIDETFGGHIGYSILPSEQKKGYGMRLVKLAMKYCKEELKLASIRAGCYEYNIASKRILERLGMKQIDINGGIIKSLYFELKL